MLGGAQIGAGPGFLPRNIVETFSTLMKWDNLVFTLQTLKVVRIPFDKMF